MHSYWSRKIAVWGRFKIVGWALPTNYEKSYMVGGAHPTGLLKLKGYFRLKFFKLSEPFGYAQDKPRPKGQEKFNRINETSATLSHLDSINYFPRTVVCEGRYPANERLPHEVRENIVK